MVMVMVINSNNYSNNSKKSNNSDYSNNSNNNNIYLKSDNIRCGGIARFTRVLFELPC